ncbi:MAG: exodeoxyribonuclease III [Chitinophagaceae bacterium]|nr:exodeoxyribonuclease III [Chitinophagaceae bacterium]
MKIATYNINGIGARLPVLLKWLEESKPDIACLQELKAPQERFPLDDIKMAGYNASWVGQKSWNGVAVLSKNIELKEHLRALPGDDTDIQSRYLECSSETLSVSCLYLPNGNPVPGPKFDYKLSWMKRLHDHSGKLVHSTIPTILTGDYNVIPEEQDVYKVDHVIKDALFQPESRNAYRDLLSLGWTDTLRHLFPNERIYTYWDYFRNAYGRNAGMRIDHFLLNTPALKVLKGAGVDKYVRGWEKTSDHAPVWIELDL